MHKKPPTPDEPTAFALPDAILNFSISQSLNLLSLPGIVESNGTVLEFLADDFDLLEVLLAVFPLLLVVK